MKTTIWNWLAVVLIFMLQAGHLGAADQMSERDNVLIYEGRKFTLTNAWYSHDYLFPLGVYETTFGIVVPGMDCLESPAVGLMLASRGTRRFREGTFSWVPGIDDEEDDFLLPNPLNMIVIPHGSDPSKWEGLKIVDGAVTVLGTAPHFELEFDFLLENGRRVEGRYSGPWETYDAACD